MQEDLTSQAKGSVKVRSKKLADGSESLYLDIYHKGNRTYEFLHLYLLPEINAAVKKKNRLTLSAAESIRSTRMLQLASEPAKFRTDKSMESLTLTEWLDRYLENRLKVGLRNPEKLRSIIKVLKGYCSSHNRKLRTVDRQWVSDFLNWLRKDYRSANGRGLKNGSIALYASKLSNVFNMAFRRGHIEANPFTQLPSADKVKAAPSERQFLTVNEVMRLADTPCCYPQVKNAFLFSCFSGLRISDILALNPKNIRSDIDGQTIIEITMRKTGKLLRLPLSKSAATYLPVLGATDGSRPYFGDLPTLSTVNKALKRWVLDAGIDKKITYHSSRHTFGTMMMTAGADLYTVCRLMGHSDIRVTQIYAKIIDEKKIEAVRRIDILFK